MSTARTMARPVADDVAYLYGVARLVPGIDAVPSCAIIPQARVTVVTHGDLAAFVSMVPASLFDPEGFRAASADRAWLEARVVAHDRVLKELAAFCDLVPLRFGTLCPDVSRVSETLVRNRLAFDRTLDRIAGAAEWGVKLRADLAVLRGHVEATSPVIRRLREAMLAAKPGAQFFLARKLERALDDEVEANTASIIEDSHRRLAMAVREAVQIPLQAPLEGDGPGTTMMNAAYLVDRGGTSDFRRTLRRLRAPLVDLGLSLELSGPWPAYHFVSTVEDQASDGHATAAR